MEQLSMHMVLDTLIHHETLTIDDLSKTENLGVVPDPLQLQYLLDELLITGLINELNGVIPFTYTITENGIAEGERLKKVQAQQTSIKEMDDRI